MIHLHLREQLVNIWREVTAEASVSAPDNAERDDEADDLIGPHPRVVRDKLVRP